MPLWNIGITVVNSEISAKANPKYPKYSNFVPPAKAGGN